MNARRKTGLAVLILFLGMFGFSEEVKAQPESMEVPYAFVGTGVSSGEASSNAHTQLDMLIAYYQAFGEVTNITSRDVGEAIGVDHYWYLEGTLVIEWHSNYSYWLYLLTN